MIHEKMVVVPSFFLQQENTFGRRETFQIFVSYNGFKRQGQKGSVIVKTARKEIGDKPILAICYDFDRTLSPEDMQAQGYIQSIGYDVADFWKESNSLAADNDMDQNLAYMYTMVTKARGRLVFNKEILKADGAKIKLYPGVDTWFTRVNQYGQEKGITIEHYIISSGLKEMIEGTMVAKYFKKIYASSFYFDDVGVAVWPAQAVNYTNKTQYLFRIKKGILDINDQKVNDYFDPDKVVVPFRNMVYIGDSDTDIPCMKLVNSNGGYSIGVYDSETQDKTKVFKMLREHRIKYFAPADYREGSSLEGLIKNIVDRTKTNEVLERKYFKCFDEMSEEQKNKSIEEIHKNELIIQLEESRSFANTHEIIKQLYMIEDWDNKQKDKLIHIAITNTQVKFILSDNDIQKFFKRIIGEIETEEIKEVKELMDM